jgi:SAM-dependent methyltransferase
MKAADRQRYRREAAFHDHVFAQSDSARAAADKFYSVTRSSKALFRELIAANCGRQVLEYGCGPHTHAILFHPKGAVVTGVDISPVAVAQRRELAGKHNLPVQSCVMNGESLAFADGVFDLVCGTGILHHLDLGVCLPELRRVLKHGGKAIFIEPLGHNPLINLYRRMTPSMRSVDEHPLLTRDFALARRHFGRVEIHYFHLASLMAVPFRSFSWQQRLVRLLDGVDRVLFRCCPPLRKHAWAAIVVMTAPAP